MDILYSDFDKRFLSALANNSTSPASHYKSDAQVMREMAEVWVESGGDAGGFSDDYVRQLRAMIAKVEKEGI